MDWLDNEGFVVFLFVKLLSEVVHLLWEDPGFWKEVIIVWEYFRHPHEISAKIIFSRQLIHPRVMIDSLMRLKLGELLRSGPGYVAPIYVPVAVLIIHHLVSELFQCFAHDYISALRCAQVQKRLLFLRAFLVIPAIIFSETLHSQRVHSVHIARVIGSSGSASGGKSFIL